jgi:hypothetical protein
MKRSAATFVAVTLAWAVSAVAQSAQTTAPQTSAQASASADASSKSPALPKGTRLVAELKTKVDTKHTKAGDPIVVEVKGDVKSGNDVVLKKGSQIKGTIGQVQEYSQGKGSEVDIVFDSVVPKSGGEFPNHFAVFALAAKLEKQPDDIYSSGGTKRLGTSAGISGQVQAPRDQDITPQSTGIFGFDSFELHPLVGMTPPTATVNSRSGNIVLEKGTTLVLESVGQ